MTRTNFNEGLALIAEIPGTRNFGLLGVPFKRARRRIGHAQTYAHRKLMELLNWNRRSAKIALTLCLDRLQSRARPRG